MSESQSLQYVIFGGAGGIGRVVTDRLAVGGHEVVVTGREHGSLKVLESSTGVETAVVDARRYVRS